MSLAHNTELQARIVAEHDLDYEFLPGTELLTDIGDVHRVHAHNAPNSTVLVPQPSASPDDPLVWIAKSPKDS